MASAGETMSTLNVEKIRQDFPVLGQQVQGKGLVYLDNAATTQKPQSVIDTVANFYGQTYATIHRGVYYLSQKATSDYDTVRDKCRDLLGAKKSAEIIFVRGATEAINLVAFGYGRKFVGKGDEIVISQLEHHANIVPWQELCKAVGANLKIIPCNDKGELDLDAYKKLLGKQTKIVAIGHVSNALGTVNPVKEMVKLGKAAGAVVLVDGAQAVPHMKVNVQDLGCDFYCFSGHKTYGTTGSGVLYGRLDLLNEMNPYQTGGEMIERVTFDKTTFGKPPLKFEAGTPAIAEVLGLGAAIDYMQKLGLDKIEAYEQHLLQLATDRLSKISGLKIVGQAAKKGAIVSFVFDEIHPHDIGTILDQEGIAIRTGHHCAQPVMDRFGIPATSRASFAFYNTAEEIEKLAQSIEKALQLLK